MNAGINHYTYETFDILVGDKTPQGYPVTVVQSPAGEGNVLCRLETDAELQDALTTLESGETDADFLHELGSFFFSTLFTGDIGQLYRTSLGMVRSQGKGLRVRLRITPPVLAALPWEYLYDQEERVLLSTSAETVLVRYIPLRVPARPTTIQLPLRVLAVISSPHDLQSLDTEQEKNILRAALAQWIEQRQVQLQLVEHATIANINQAMRSFQPHVFHFVGHALFEHDTALVALEDESKNAQFVNEQVFQEFFTGSPETRVAILNACQTATISARQPLVGLAPRLLQRQLAAVVAMQFPIPDHTSLVFVREFYRSIALGYPVDAAMAEARKGILQEIGSGRPDYGIPVLFLRAKDGHLFKVEEQPTPPLEIPPPPQPKGPPEIIGFVGRENELAYFAERLTTEQLAIITGMAGVGKTALAVTLTGWIGKREQVFWHSFNERSGLDGLIRDLAGFLAWHGKPDLWRLIESTRLTGGKLPPIETLFDYLLQLLRRGSYLLCLDDFQYVDEDPVLNQFAERLRSSLAAGDLSIIVTSRRMPEFVRRSEFRPLTGLSINDVRHLLLTRNILLTSTQIEELYTHTEGNAEFLTLAVEALQQAKNPDYLIENLAKTDDVEYYLLNEVDEGLTGQERAVIGALAVLLGYGGTRSAIESVLNGGNVFRVLMRLSERHLLSVRKGEDDREYNLHDMVRAFYYEQIRPQRRAMHHRAGEYYRSTEALDLLRASLHFQLAGNYAEAAQIATQDVWSIINRGQARDLKTILTTFSAEQLNAEPWARVNLARGLTHGFLAEQELATTSYQNALEILESLLLVPTTYELQAQAYRGLGELLELEAPQDALAWLQRGLAALKGRASLERAALLAKIGGVHMQLGEYAEAMEALTQSLADLTDEPTQLRSIALMNLGSVYYYQGDLSKARITIQQALVISKKLYDQYQVANLLIIQAMIEYESGDWQQVIELSETALGLANTLGSDLLKATVEVNLASTYLEMDNVQAASRYLADCLQLVEQNHWTQLEIFALIHTARLNIRQAEWESAHRKLVRAEELANEIDLKAALIYSGRTKAELKLLLGHTTEATHLIEQSTLLAQQLHETSEEARNYRVLGQIFFAIEQPQAAITAYEQALALLNIRDPYEIAMTKFYLSQAYMALNQQERAIALRKDAEHIFSQLGVAQKAETSVP